MKLPTIDVLKIAQKPKRCEVATLQLFLKTI